MLLPHEALGNRISELSAHLNAAKAQLLELIAEFDECGGWADEGCLTCAHWLNWKCGVSTTAAREQVRVARALRELRISIARSHASMTLLWTESHPLPGTTNSSLYC